MEPALEKGKDVVGEKCTTKRKVVEPKAEWIWFMRAQKQGWSDTRKAIKIQVRKIFSGSEIELILIWCSRPALWLYCAKTLAAWAKLDLDFTHESAFASRGQCCTAGWEQFYFLNVFRASGRRNKVLTLVRLRWCHEGPWRPWCVSRKSVWVF